MLAILLAFIPWILFFGLYNGNAPLAVLLAGAGTMLLVAGDIRKKKPVKILPLGGLIFFIAVGIVLITGSLNGAVSTAVYLLAQAVLAIIALVSILLGKPFTMQYARDDVPEIYWGHPLFVSTNYHLSWVWFGLFCINFAVPASGVFMSISYPSAVNYTVPVLTLLFGAWYNSWYVKKERERQTLISTNTRKEL